MLTAAREPRTSSELVEIFKNMQPMCSLQVEQRYPAATAAPSKVVSRKVCGSPAYLHVQA